MKLLALLMLAAAGHAFSDEKDMFKKWTMMKAQESCWGEETAKQYTIAMKKAVSKCLQIDMPELDLPPYKSPYRLINTLLSGAENQEQKMKDRVLMTLMHSKFKQSGSSSGWMEGHFKKLMMKKMFEELMGEDSGEQMDMDMDGMMMKYFMDEKKDDFDDFSFGQKKSGNFRQRLREMMGNRRFKRQALGSTKPNPAEAENLPGILEMGDRLAEKLKKQEEHMLEKIGNFTCIMREMHVLNDNNEIDVRAMKNDLESYNVPSAWFKQRVGEAMDMCYEMTKNLPPMLEEMYSFPGYPNMAKIKKFMKCCKYTKSKLCMYNDVKSKLELHFRPLDKILEQTNLTEWQLFPLIIHLLHGEEMEFM